MVICFMLFAANSYAQCKTIMPVGVKIKINGQPHYAFNLEEIDEILNVYSCKVEKSMYLKDLEDDNKDLMNENMVLKVNNEELTERADREGRLRKKQEVMFNKRLDYLEKKRRERVVLGGVVGTVLGIAVGSVVAVLATK